MAPACLFSHYNEGHFLKTVSKSHFISSESHHLYSFWEQWKKKEHEFQDSTLGIKKATAGYRWGNALQHTVVDLYSD